MTGEAQRDGRSHVDNTANNAGIQAGGNVIGSTVYLNNYVTGDDPEDIYAAGVRYLEDGAVSEARRQIDRAMRAGHESAEVRFSWVLAMLSKRSIRDLSREDRETLAAAAHRFADWCDARMSADKTVSTNHEAGHLAAVAVVSDLVICLLEDPSDTDRITGIEKRIHDLPTPLRSSVGKHLGQVLQATTEDRLWLDTVKRAKATQTSSDRTNRAWMYFEPCPTPVWIRSGTDPREERRWIRPVLGALPVTALGVFGVGYLGWAAATSLVPGVILAFVIAVTGAWFLARHAFEWRYRLDRLRAEESRQGPGPADKEPTETTNGSGGFADRVTRYFDYYFGKYRPPEFRRAEWLSETGRLRYHLYAEVERAYRSSDATAESIAWLIRHLASSTRSRWCNGTLYDFRTRYAVAGSTKASALVSGLVTAGAVLVVLPAAWQAAWFTTLLAVVACSLTVQSAASRWYSFARSIRAYQDDQIDRDRDREQRQRSYEKWVRKLERRPREDEMTAWFDCDTTLLIDEALRAYGLRRSDVESHVVLSTKMPTGASYRVKSARDAMGPWRYSRYELSVFLVLSDGLHSYTRRWNFERAEPIGDAKRFHFPLEKIESGSSPNDRSVSLRLIGGTTKHFTMSDDGTVEPEGHQPQEEDDHDNVDPMPESPPGPDLNVYRDASGLIELRRTFERVSQRAIRPPVR